MSNKRVLDKVIKSLDANKEEGFDILEAKIQGGKLIIKYKDKLYGETDTMSFSKNEAMDFKKDPWNTWRGNTKSVVEQFIGSKVHDSKAKDEDSKKLYVINLWDKDGKFLATRGMFKNDAEAEEHAKRNTKPGGRYKFYRANPNGTKMKDEESYFESMRPKKYKIFGDIVLLKSLTGSTATYTTSNGQTVRIGRRKWDELARKINKEENK